MGLEVVTLALLLIILFYDNNGTMTQSKEPRNHQKGKTHKDEVLRVL